MVQLPSAARLSGNRKPALPRRLLQRLQDAAGLDRDGEVGRVQAAHRIHALQAQHDCVPLSSGVAPTARPVLPPCVTMGVPVAAQARTTSATSLRAARPHHGQRLAARALAPVLFLGGQVAFGEDVACADDGAQVASMRIVVARMLRGQAAGRARGAAAAARASAQATKSARHSASRAAPARGSAATRRSRRAPRLR